MKTKLTIAALLGLMAFAFIFNSNSTENSLVSESIHENKVVQGSITQPVPDPLNGNLDKFYVGAINGEEDYHSFLGSPYLELDALKFNLWHQYVSDEWNAAEQRFYPASPFSSGAPSDNLMNPVSVYSGLINSNHDDINDHMNRKLLMMRPKIEYLLYGQRSDYQCEAGNYDPDLWFYAFNTHQAGDDYQDNTQYGSSQWVRRCIVNNNQTDGGAGWVVKSLRANTEQCKRFGKWSGDSCKWLIKPRIRIDSTVAHNQQNVLVCNINIIGQDGSTELLNVDIHANDFLVDGSGLYYNGRYIDEFYNLTDNLKIADPWGDKFMWKARGYNTAESGLENNADIQVYWYGQCDMWIDYIRVDNDVADELLNGVHDDWIQDEAEMIGSHKNVNNNETVALKYYMELCEFNNLPCMAYVNEKLKYWSNLYGSPGVDLVQVLTPDNMSFHVPWDKRTDIWNADFLMEHYINKVGFSAIYSECYPINACYNTPQQSQLFSKIPETMPIHTGNELLGKSVSVVDYEEWLQTNFDQNPSVWEGGPTLNCDGSNTPPVSNISQFPGQFRDILQMCDELSKRADKPIMFMPQAHGWYNGWEVHREPTNEELEMMSNIAVSYGSRALVYFYFPSENYPSPKTPNRNYPYSAGDYGIGLSDKEGTKYKLREINVYGQQPTNGNRYKWEVIRDISDRLSNKWGQYLMSFDNHNRHSYIYRLTEERNAMYQNEYFYDIYTFKPGSEPFQCVEDFPEGIVPPENTIGECKQDRYLQVATFENPNELYTNYFMLVNRRCSPHRPEISENGGYRQIQVYFNQNASQLERYDNWKITDVENPANVITYVKGQTLLDFGWFEPGEGKLYKMEPVIRSGGILAGDENISGESFTCQAPVYNNGHNITIGANTTIHFNDLSRFVMNGGVFTVGDQNISAPQNITSDAVSGSSWSGHSFTNCEVKIYGATFTGLANDTTYAVNIIDCPVVDIRNCTFNTNSSLKGGINAVFFSDPNNEITLSNIYIGANTFNSSSSTIPTVNISSYAGETTPLIIENNIFNEGNTAIFLSGITGGAIKGNSITDNFIGINALTSAIDIKSNTISSTINSAIGIFAAGGSELKMNNAGSKSLGGLNDISNSGTAANNIVVDGSVFLLDGGQNIFNITVDQNSKHLYGYFPQFTQGPFDETNNCFKLNSTPVDPPYNIVTSGFQGSQITFNFTPYLTGCDPNQSGDGLAINLGDGIYDTIYNEGSGSGGSMKEALPLSKGEYSRELGREGVYYTLPTAKQRYDSISVLMRYRNYTQAKTKCLDLINTYPDSIQSLNAISKLFLSTVASDTSYNAVNELKIYYEDLILNHGYNTSLVKRANYYILKCKVRMREYSQALVGFQQIINQNPYSYEGLIARWDYMATSLLIQGQSGGFPTLKLRELHSLELREVESYDPDDLSDEASAQSDRSPFTKEQRQDIRKSINTAIEISKDEDDRKIKTLEVKSEQGDVNASKVLEQIRSLKQVVKTEKPISIVEHVRIVSEDIRKVFGSNTSGKGNEPKNIPMVFRLSQNYPNPFNPVTKINYDLPKDSKVKIVIYDILGREIKRLVNNELKTAGFYIVDFNASNYASGVYFYRIEAEEPNGNKFVDSKKMVLLK